MQDRVLLSEGLVLCSEPAVYCRDDGALAIADLHLGYEASLQAEHVAIPRFQLDSMTVRLKRLIDKYNPEKIIINGDMKHEFSRNMGQEWDEVEKVLDIIEENATPIVIKGNHDNYLSTIVARRGIEIVDSYRIASGNLVFVHGHGPLHPKKGFRVYGHEHPVVRLRDDVGARVSLPCFLYDEINNFLIMPAFSPLASGTNVLSPVESFMIEELRCLDISRARVYAIGEEGILDFGEVRKLKGLHTVEGERKSNNRRNPCQTGEHG